jgi:hypothetical protein
MNPKVISGPFNSPKITIVQVEDLMFIRVGAEVIVFTDFQTITFHISQNLHLDFIAYYFSFSLKLHF